MTPTYPTDTMIMPGIHELVRMASALLRETQEGQMPPSQAMQHLLTIIARGLELWNASASIKNAGQIGSLLRAAIAPSDLMSRFLLGELERGGFPEMNSGPVHPSALHRGAAVFLSGIALSDHCVNISTGAEKIAAEIEASGHLHREEDIRE